MTGHEQPLQGRVALVVGASQGIGRAYARALAAAGADVVAAARTVLPDAGGLDSLTSLVHESRTGGGRVIALGCDVEREDDVNRLVEQCIANLGRIDVVVNAAATYPRLDALRVTVEEWDRSFAVNVRGAYLVVRAAVPHMIERRTGSIVNITSLSGRRTERDSAAHRLLMVYGVTKAALDRMTTWFAEELRPYGIAVNALSPGGVLTDSWKREGPDDYAAAERAGAHAATPEHIGPPLVYLARQSADTLTAQILHAKDFRTTWATEDT